MLGLGSGAAGCEGPAVEARAVWVDGVGGDGERRIHIYDRGARESLSVLGQGGPQEFLRLGPRGRGVLLRVGSELGAWFDLEDGRRLPLRLPSLELSGRQVSFSADGRALWWRESGALGLIALAAGAAILDPDTSSAQQLSYAGDVTWAASASAAPVLLVRDREQRGAFLRYPVRADEQLRVGAHTPTLPLTSTALRVEDCGAVASCRANVGLTPDGQLAYVLGGANQFFELDARAPALAGELELAPELTEATSISLLQLFDRSVSVWSAPGQLLRWDRRSGHVEKVPIFFPPPLHWTEVERGRAMVLVSSSGQLLRVDARGGELLNLETTDCALRGSFAPVVSPSGRYAAWTCADTTAIQAEQSGVDGAIVRVSREGLERFVGVPTRAVAIDDEGGLLLYSVRADQPDAVDVIGPDTRPRNLFVLTPDGVLTRIDELEPAPAPALTGTNAYSTYIQGTGVLF